MPAVVLSPHALARVLAIVDLTNPQHGPHALQTLLDVVEQALAHRWGCRVRRHRAHPVTTVEDNYDALGYPPDGAARDARYTRYLNATQLLRTQTSAMVPPLLRVLTLEEQADVLLVCPGLVYRRDCVDRLHVGEPHQVDLWRITHATLTVPDLEDMAHTVVAALWPDAPLRLTPTRHPYTLHGLQMDVLLGSTWVEVGECGLAHPNVLQRQGLRDVTGLAMGLGLDRLLMVKKGIPDIRLLRARDPRIAQQMLDLTPYRPVSLMPPLRRDISIAVPLDTVAEDLGDQVRGALGNLAASVEAVEVLSETAWEDLSPVARGRLGMVAGQKNVLLRIVLRDLERTLTDVEGNQMRDHIYAALHQGTVHQWAR